MKKVFVTGATGFIGRKLAQALAERGTIVHALCRNTNHPHAVRHKNIRYFKGDITDSNSVREAMLGCEEVYHSAALAKMWCRNRNDFYHINVTGTKNVLAAASEHRIHKIVYTSSCGVIGPTVKLAMNENDPRITGFAIDYERTKYLAELEVQGFAKNGLPVVIVSPSRVYGEGPITDSNTVGKMVRGYLQGKWRFIPGCGDQMANYAYLDDVVNGHLLAMERGVPGEKYILGGEDVSFNCFFRTLEELSHKKIKMYHLPLTLISAFSRMEKIKTKLTGLPPRFLPEFAERLKYHQKYRSDKAVGQLGYTITPFTEGIRRTIEYIKSL